MLVFIGGGSGALLRWWIGSLVRAPQATLAVNVLGCLAMGILAGALARSGGNEPARLLVGVGLLGGFTTMSAFAQESVQLWMRSPFVATAYLGATVAGSLLAFAIGLALSR